MLMYVGNIKITALQHRLSRALEGEGILSEFYRQSESVEAKNTLTPLCSQQNEFEEQATRRVDDLLESYMGIRDLELGKVTHMNPSPSDGLQL